MKRMLARRLRRLANKLDPQPKLVITGNCGAEPDIGPLLAAMRRNARVNGRSITL